MGDKIDIYKITLDFLKDNKLILYVVAALGIGAGGGHFIPKMATAKPVEVTVVTPKQDNKCHECAGLQSQINSLTTKYNALNNKVSGIDKRYSKTVRDFHGGR